MLSSIARVSSILPILTVLVPLSREAVLVMRLLQITAAAVADYTGLTTIATSTSCFVLCWYMLLLLYYSASTATLLYFTAPCD